MSQLAPQLGEADATDPLDVHGNLPLQPRSAAHADPRFEDAAALFCGRPARRHLPCHAAGFLDVKESPGTLLRKNMPQADTISQALVYEVRSSHNGVGHRGGWWKDLRPPTAFGDCGKEFGDCHDSSQGSMEDTPYQVDIRPWGVGRLAKTIGGTAATMMDQFMNPHALTVLALALVWFPYGHVGAKALAAIPPLSLQIGKIPDLKLPALNFESISLPDLSGLGRGIVNGAKAAGDAAANAGDKAADAAADAKAAGKAAAKGAKNAWGKINWGKINLKGINLKGINLEGIKHGFEKVGKGALKGIKHVGEGLNGINLKGINLEGIKHVGGEFEKFGKGAWTGIKHVGEGVGKVAAGALGLGRGLNEQVKALGRAMVSGQAADVAREASYTAMKAALVAGGVVLVAGVALHALKHYKNRRRGARGLGGGAGGGAGGRRGRRTKGGARERAMEEAAERAKAQSEEFRQERQNGEIVPPKKKKRLLYNHLAPEGAPEVEDDRPTLKDVMKARRAAANANQDLMMGLDPRDGSQGEMVGPGGKAGLLGAVGATGLGMALGARARKQAYDDLETGMGNEVFHEEQPGSVVFGKRGVGKHGDVGKQRGERESEQYHEHNPGAESPAERQKEEEQLEQEKPEEQTGAQDHEETSWRGNKTQPKMEGPRGRDLARELRGLNESKTLRGGIKQWQDMPANSRDAGAQYAESASGRTKAKTAARRAVDEEEAWSRGGMKAERPNSLVTKKGHPIHEFKGFSRVRVQPPRRPEDEAELAPTSEGLSHHDGLREASSDIYSLSPGSRRRAVSVPVNREQLKVMEMRNEYNTLRASEDAAIRPGKQGRQQAQGLRREQYPNDLATGGTEFMTEEAKYRRHHADPDENFSEAYRRSMSPQLDRFKRDMTQPDSKRVATSELQIKIEPTPRELRASRRASAFLEIAGETVDLDGSTASFGEDAYCADIDRAMGDDALFPLYYLDAHGQQRDFLNPSLLKPAYRRFSVGIGAIGYHFLGATIPQQQFLPGSASRDKNPDFAGEQVDQLWLQAL